MDVENVSLVLADLDMRGFGEAMKSFSCSFESQMLIINGLYYGSWPNRRK